MGCNPDQHQDVVDLGGESNRGASEQFVEKDFNGVKPVKILGRRAICYSFIIVPFAEVPESNLVEIVKAQGACEGVDKHSVGAGIRWDNVCQVEFVKVNAADYNVVADIASNSLEGGGVIS